MCNKCNDTRVISETICILCEDNLPHSSCDDTWSVYKACDCRPLTKFDYRLDHCKQYPIAKLHTGRETLIAILMRELK